MTEFLIWFTVGIVVGIPLVLFVLLRATAHADYERRLAQNIERAKQLYRKERG